MIKKNDKNPIENAEYGLDSRYSSKTEQESEAFILMESRLERMKNVSKDQIVRAKLMQLKLKMEDYLLQPVYDNRNHFTEFLETYIDAIYSKRNVFARDIDISAVNLSQVINNHREPKDDFIMKLMIHSEKMFAKVCDFQKKMWLQVYYHEKLCDTMANQHKWRPNIEKSIRISKSIA